MEATELFLHSLMLPGSLLKIDILVHSNPPLNHSLLNKYPSVTSLWLDRCCYFLFPEGTGYFCARFDVTAHPCDSLLRRHFGEGRGVAPSNSRTKENRRRQFAKSLLSTVMRTWRRSWPWRVADHTLSAPYHVLDNYERTIGISIFLVEVNRKNKNKNKKT